ncbi:hypothetical protein SAMN04487785_105131 [Dyella jiangningensis]|uniref:putative hemolysin n=1 Tax=Dyella sp. AtDHG13 TaxID=1938897 RepID=UPI000882D84B|nr:DUF333 domain-containing protein [Dyella sp. AtDHG13]PXV58306.1 hypothetical protein BDW41_106188 [Dyella sp. AtDHG13]SDK07906.1 hypothetical protein SAMN04487785_105131 [Dyella jiangningensis]
MKTLATALLALALSACATSTPSTHDQPPSSIGMANPASVACVNQGGKLDLRKDAAGNVNGICVFPDGRQCEEWALFRDHQCVMPATKP